MELSKPASILYGKIAQLVQIYGTPDLPREIIQPLLNTFPKHFWEELFKNELVGYEDNILYTNVEL